MKFSVSSKAVLFHDDQIVLLRNLRGEWELPGGRLEAGEQPDLCVARECEEELGVAIEITRLVHAWIFSRPQRDIVILAYTGRCKHPDPRFVLSDEHTEVGLFSPQESLRLDMPKGYRHAIAKAIEA